MKSKKSGHRPDIHVLELPTWARLEVNALQRASTVVIQKSLREGFGLTVAKHSGSENRWWHRRLAESRNR